MAVALLAFGPVAAGAQVPHGPLEEGFFDLRAERIPDRLALSTLVDTAGAVLIPVAAVARHLGIPVESVEGVLRLEWPAGVWETRLVPWDGRIFIGSDPVPLAPGDWVVLDGEHYASAALLSRLIDAPVSVDWPDLAVVVARNDDFPAIRVGQRELARASAREFARDPMAPVPYAARTAPGALGWGLSVLESDDGVRATGRGTLGLALLGGSLELGGTAVSELDGAIGADDPLVRYTRVLPGNRVLQQMAFGHVTGGGPLPRRMIGATFSNRPALTPRRFGEVTLAPAVPEGWEVEVYRGEHLVGVSEPGDGEGLRAPLDYGDTPVRIRMLGPAGQEIVQNLLYSVPTGRVPAGQWWYDLGGGRCGELEPCESLVFGELAHGLASWATLSAGVERITGGGEGEGDSGEMGPAVTWRPHGGFSVSPRPNLTAELQLFGEDYVRGSISLATASQGGITANWARRRQDAGVATGFEGWTAGVTASAPVFGRRWASARVDLRGRDGGRVDAWQARLTTTAGATHLALDHESGFGPAPLTVLRVHHTLLARGRGMVQDLTLGLAGGWAGGRMALGEGTLSVRPGGVGVLSASVGWRRALEPLVSVSWAVRAPFGFLQAREVQGRHRSRFASMDGGVAFGSGGVVALPHGAVGRSGLTVDVFHDVNGDGVRGPGEPAAPGVGVDVGGRKAEADGSGRARSWDLTPYEAVPVSVDPLTVDPEWAPPAAPVWVRPSPNSFTRVSVALRQTREVSGRLTLEEASGARVLGSALLHLEDLSGNRLASVRTFHDGVFYLEALSPGSYRLGLDGGVARALGLDEAVFPFVVPAAGDGALDLADLVLRLGPRS